jgi:predicted ribosome quality control (RQC) complex YloA/Tae2 family protein
MELQSEKVRKVLWQKEHDVLQRRPHTFATLGDAAGDEERLARLEQLQDLRKEEELLRESSRLLAANYQKLRSRARKLRDQANEIEKTTATSATSESPSEAITKPPIAGNAASDGVATDATTASSNSASSKPSERIARQGDSPAKKEKVTSG